MHRRQIRVGRPLSSRRQADQGIALVFSCWTESITNWCEAAAASAAESNRADRQTDREAKRVTGETCFIEIGLAKDMRWKPIDK